MRTARGILNPAAAASRSCFGTPFRQITFQALVRITACYFGDGITAT
jgi:hypothetical protein